MDKPLRLSVTSDIHLGHRRNEAAFIIKNLNAHITNDAHLSQIDLLVLAGDIFDDLLPLNSDDVPHIKAWIAHTLRLCHKYGVTVRVLEGTPSHDRAQSMLFPAINEIHEHNAAMGVDLKWVRELCVERIEKFGVDILYIPDEWSHSTPETLAQAQAALEAAGLEQVDIAIMHGQFRYQMPMQVKDDACHNEAAYMAMVRYLIFIGHIHIHSRYEKIVAQGSFDRISHGEEGPKGFVTATLHPDGASEVTFVENTGARRFVTVNCYHAEVEENLKLIDREVENLPAASFVRVKSGYGNAILTNMDALRSRWPLLVWTPPKTDQADGSNDMMVVETSDIYVPIRIDRHNLKDLVLPRLSKLSLDDEILRRCVANLTEMQQL